MTLQNRFIVHYSTHNADGEYLLFPPAIKTHYLPDAIQVEDMQHLLEGEQYYTREQ